VSVSIDVLLSGCQSDVTGHPGRDGPEEQRCGNRVCMVLEKDAVTADQEVVIVMIQPTERAVAATIEFSIDIFTNIL